jgi:hypothetical protein
MMTFRLAGVAGQTISDLLKVGQAASSFQANAYGSRPDSVIEGEIWSSTNSLRKRLPELGTYGHFAGTYGHSIRVTRGHLQSLAV